MSYLLNNFDKVFAATLEHLALTLTALAISLLIAVPLGVFLARRPRLYGPSIAGLSILYTIPSISLLAIFIPLIGLGFWPTVLALVIYCQAILVRNTVVGIRGVDAAVVESARGMGLNDTQLLLRVELPLALPVILAGVRIAAISTISIATVAAYFDAGGLGALIREGISQDYGAKIMAGVIAVAALAVVVEQLLRVLVRRSERHRTAVAPGS